MADRTLLQWDEDTDLRGFWARLRIERSSAGAPGGLITVEQHEGPEGGRVEQCTIVVDDLRRLYAATDWASDISPEKRAIQQLGKVRIGSSIMRETDEAILQMRRINEATEKGEPVTLNGIEYVPATASTEVGALRALLGRVRSMGRAGRYVQGDALASYIDGGLAAIEHGGRS